MSASTLLDGAISAFDGIRQTVTGTGKLVSEFATVHRQLYEARGECLRLQDDNTTLKARIVELETALRREDAFDREQEKFQLKEVGPRSFAYALKDGAGNEEPAHLLCVPCFQDRKLSILQLGKRDFGADVLACSRCKAEVRVPNELRSAGATIISRGRRRSLDDFY